MSFVRRFLMASFIFALVTLDMFAELYSVKSTSTEILPNHIQRQKQQFPPDSMLSYHSHLINLFVLWIYSMRQKNPLYSLPTAIRRVHAAPCFPSPVVCRSCVGYMWENNWRFQFELKQLSPQRKDVFCEGLFLVLKRDPHMCLQRMRCLKVASFKHL